jgi:hypothetical protein
MLKISNTFLKYRPFALPKRFFFSVENDRAKQVSMQMNEKV